MHIKIAYIIDSIATPAAGTEKQLLYLLRHLDRARFSPHLICLHPSAWLKTQTFDFPVDIMHVGSMKSPAFFRDIGKIKKRLREYNVDIAQTFFVDGNIYGTIAAHRAGVPVVISSRRNIGYWHNRFQVMILRLLRRWTDHYLANSQAVIETTIETEKAPRAKLNLIYNGLDLARFRTVDAAGRDRVRREWDCGDDAIVVGAVANLRPVKNIELLITTAAKLAEKDKRVHLVVVGEGPNREEYQRLIDHLGLGDRIKLVGQRQDIETCLAGFDIAVLASQSESFSNSLIEYMAAGKPVVASAVGGNVEAIEHEVSGLTFSLDRPESLREALQRLIDDPALAGRLGETARNIAHERYSWETCLAAHEAYYADLVRGTDKS